MHLLTAVLLIVTIRTYDGYGVAAADLQTAIAVASTTLSGAGVKTVWIDCRAETASDRCRAVANRSEIIVRITRASELAGEVLGTAAVDTVTGEGSLATLYADRIEAHASAAGSDPGTVLGRAAAHEIGHLLMGTTAHARSGLMRAHWSRADVQRRFARDWRFSAEEARRIRSGVAARTNAAPADLDAVVASAALGRQDER